jgi:hypothetical protein
MTVGFGLLNVALAVALTPLGLVGVALATAITMTLKNLVFMASYCSYLMEVPAATFYQPLISGFIGTVMVGGGAYTTSQIVRPESWIELGLLALPIAGIYVVLTFWVVLSREDRSIVLSVLPAEWRLMLFRSRRCTNVGD